MPKTNKYIKIQVYYGKFFYLCFMIKNFSIKYLPVILLFFIIFYSVNIKAVETVEKNNSSDYIEIKKVKNIESINKKGFIKRVLRKVAENIKKTGRRVSNKIKRFFSKRKAKKERMRSSFRNRNHNLFNILIYTGIFLLITGLFTFLFLSSVINFALFLILILAIGISTIVIALIYFSNRYILKPHYRS